MSINKLKQYLNSTDKIGILLERIGLRYIKLEQGNTLITCGLPGSANRRSVQIRLNKNLTIIIRSHNITGDIIDLVSYMTYNSFGEPDQESLKYMRQDTLRWMMVSLDGDFDEFEFDEDATYAYEGTLKDYDADNYTYNDVILNEFSSLPHISWITEGINEKTQKEFDIKYNYHDNQIIIPCRNIMGEIVSLKARNIDMVETDDYYSPKYFSLLKPNCGTDLYGLWKTAKYIKKKKQVILFESEKSVMKAWQYGYKNSVALATSFIPNRHIIQLMEVLKEGYEVVIALDNDMYLQDIKRIANKLRKYKLNITYIKQTDLTGGISLDEKDSPVDKGKRVFNYLYKGRRSFI